MAKPAEWVEGARPRTLPAALAPVLAGSGIAWFEQGFDAPKALLCLVIAMSLQVGVNYANDYSDGIRGTDAERIGPMRLVGSGAATPAQVKTAAFACFGVAALAGLALVLITQVWWLLAVGLAAILSAWYYTGGRRPYGYQGLGEVSVFLFFGLVAVGGTTFVQLGRVPVPALWAAVSIGALACAILVANNLRDIAGDVAAGKHTLATRLGDRGTRTLFIVLVGVAAAAVVGVAFTSTWWALLGWCMIILLAGAVRLVRSGALGRELVTVLKLTGLAELVCATGMFVGMIVGR